MEMLIHMTRLQFKKEYLLLELSLSCQISYFFCENISTNNFFPLKIRFWNQLPHFNIPFTGKSISTNVAGRGTTCDVTSGAQRISLKPVVKETGVN